MTPPPTTDAVPLRQSTWAWFLISLQTFGGPAGQIAVMQRELVDERRWIGEKRFLHALNYCMLLPGPEAQQLAIYTGWLLNGWLGGLIAGVLFVIPGVVALLAPLRPVRHAGRHHAGGGVVPRPGPGGARHRGAGSPADRWPRTAQPCARRARGGRLPGARGLRAAVPARGPRRRPRRLGPGPLAAVAAGRRGAARARGRDAAADRGRRPAPRPGLAAAQPDHPGRRRRAVGDAGRRGLAARGRLGLRRPGALLRRDGAGHLRWRLRGAGLRRPGGRRDLRLADRRRDGARASPSPRPRPDR